MTNNGRALVSAPQCAAESLTVVPEPSVSTTIFSTGDTTVFTAYTSGTDLAVTLLEGFAAGTIIVAPGTAKEEEATISNNAGGTSQGNLVITSTNSAGAVGLENAHPVGTRVVMKRDAIRPGSVRVVNNSGSATDETVLDAAGTGTVTSVDIVGGGTGTVSGSIDYALGSINLTASAATAYTAGAATYKLDRLTDTPAEVNSGKNFFKNFARMSNGRADLPTGAVISNLGSAEVGVFVESTQSATSSSFTNNQNAANVVLKGFGSKTVNFEGGMPAEMRIRAGTDSQASMTPSTKTERNNDPGVIDVAFFSVTNANGGSN